MRLNNFRASYAANGEASDYVSSVSVIDHGHTVLTKDIRVNDFLGYDDVAVYQQDYGWAPRLVVRNPAGTVVFDGSVEFFDDPKNAGNKGIGEGVLKVPDFAYTVPGASQALQIGARLALFPDARVLPSVQGGSIDPSQTQFGPGGVLPRNPVMDLQLWVGDLGLNGGAAQDVNQLDTDHMQPYFVNAHVIPLALGQTQKLDLPGAGGKPTQFSITFAGLHQYSLFLVKKDSGVAFVYASFGLIMAGLLSKLYMRPLLERRERTRRGAPVMLDSRWTAAVSGEPQPAEPDEVSSPVGGLGGRLLCALRLNGGPLMPI